MNKSLNLVLLLITLIYVILVLKSIRKKKLQMSFSIFWLITGVLLILALAIPNLVESISQLLGFEVATSMVFCIAIFILFYLIFTLTLFVSIENKKTTALIQEISMLKKRVKELENKRK